MVNHWELLAPIAIGKLMIDGEEITNATGTVPMQLVLIIGKLLVAIGKLVM